MTEPPTRPRYFLGQVLDAEDLVAEQTYHRQMRYLHNRLHGYGTVSGLEVEVARRQVQVGPGTGIDALGREIVVTAPLTVPLKPYRGARRWVRDVVIEWREVPGSPVPNPDGGVEYSRLLEIPEVMLVARGRAAPEALLLARLTRPEGGDVEVDTSVRRPIGPP